MIKEIIYKDINPTLNLFTVKSSDGLFKVHGYASVFNELDEHKDIVVPGAFLESIKAHKEKRTERIRLLWQHDPKFPLGIITNIYEDARGLYIEAQINGRIDKGREVIELIKQEAVQGFSIGFAIEKHEQKPKHRKILKAKLHEISIVTFPACKEARVEYCISNDEKKNKNIYLNKKSNQLQKIQNRLQNAAAIVDQLLNKVTQ